MQEDRPLASRFENFEAAPSAELWGKIGAGLVEKRKKRPVFWWFFGSAATLLLALGVWHFNEGKYPVSEKVEVLSAQKSLGREVKTSPEKNGIQANSSKTNDAPFTDHISEFSQIPARSKGKSNIVSIPKTSLAPSQMNNTGLDFEPRISSPIRVEEIIEIEKPLIVEAEVDVIPPDLPTSEPRIDPIPELETNQAPKVRGFEIGLVVGTGRGAKIYNNFIPITPPPPDMGSLYLLLDQESGNPNIDYWHPTVPIQAQLLIGKDLGNRFRISSGLGWNIYQEKVRLKVPDSLLIGQRQHYLQLPLSLDFKIIKNQKIEWSTGPGFILGYNQFKNSTLKINRYTSNIQWQMALRFHLNKDWSTFLQPHYRYQLTDTDDGKSALYRNHFYGLNLGVVRRF